MTLDYAAQLSSRWATEKGFLAFYINTPFGNDYERVWHFSQNGSTVPGFSETCDLESIGLFSQWHEYTEEEKKIVNGVLFGGDLLITTSMRIERQEVDFEIDKYMNFVRYSTWRYVNEKQRAHYNLDYEKNELDSLRRPFLDGQCFFTIPTLLAKTEVT